jgi:hypothetical protein
MALKPKYQFNETSFIDGRTLEKGATAIVHERHIPGPHWKPLNDDAKKLCAKHGIVYDSSVHLDRVAMEAEDTTVKLPVPEQLKPLQTPKPQSEDGTIDLTEEEI